MTTPDLSGLDISNAVAVAVARKSLDASRQEGQAVVSLIRAAAEVAPSPRGAVTTPSSTGEGGLDVYA